MIIESDINNNDGERVLSFEQKKINLTQERSVTTRGEDIYIGDTGGEWVDLEPGQYVSGEDIYEKSYKQERVDAVYCPCCNEYVDGSQHLYSIFKEDEKMYWLACMITHFRHISHLPGKVGYYSSYERTWGRGGYGWNKLQGNTHDEAKLKQNEIEKRRLIKNHWGFLREHEINKRHFAKLQFTSPQTLLLYDKQAKKALAIIK